MKVVRSPAELEPAERAVAIGTFDGVHLGHKAALERLGGAGLRSTVITFDPHPRIVLGYEIQLISSLARRLELLEQAGVEETLVLEFTVEVARLEPEEFVERILAPLGARVVVAAESFRFGRRRRGDVALLRELGLDVLDVPSVEGVSSSRIRDLLREGDVVAAAALLGRPAEVEGTVVAGDQRGGTLGFPTANLAVDPALLVPAYGIYAGFALGTRAAISIGVNPHYGGTDRRIEAFLLDFEGDLYGDDVRVELWQRLRDERAFESEEELVAQIAQDVEETRGASRPGS
ncbi:MAG: riboflavin biosynthesis protein RibF [Gaiellaceae bacterium]